MADILSYPGSGPDTGVTPPFLQNTIYPSDNGFGGQVSLGMGRMTRRFSDIVAGGGGEGTSEAQLQALYMALANAQNASAPNLTVNLQGLQGPPGIPGRPGIAYGSPGIGGVPGDPGKTVVLSATQQIFKYDGDGVIVAAQTITFTANTDNCSGDFTWAIKSPIGSTVRAFTSGGGTSDSTATLSGSDFDGWSEANAEISVTRNSITDTMYIYKIQEGTDAAIAFLTNQNHSFPATNGGVVGAGDYAAGISEIRAYIGTTQLDYHASNPSTYSLGTLVVTPTGKITITESTVSSQRRLTPSAFDDATDSVIVTVPVVVRNSAGTEITIPLTLTYGKNKSGEDGFSDIDIPIPYDGWEGAFTNNSPGAGSVAWTAFKIKYKGTAYTVSASNTSNEFLYWDVTAPTVLSSTATRTNAIGSGKFPACWNSSGTAYPANFMKLLTAGWVYANALSAIVADLGTVTAGTVTGGLVQTAASGARVFLDGASATKQIGAINASAAQTFQVKDDGSGYWGVEVGGVRPIVVSAAGAITLRGDKLTISGIPTGGLADLAVATGKIAASATKIWNSSTGEAAHTTAGGSIEVAGSWYHLSGGNDCDVTVQLKYNGSLVAEDRQTVLAGVYKTFNLFGIQSSGSGSVTMNSTVHSGTGYSAGLLYTRAMEDKGK
jgi:hypothetical protein